MFVGLCLVDGDGRDSKYHFPKYRARNLEVREIMCNFALGKLKNIYLVQDATTAYGRCLDDNLQL